MTPLERIDQYLSNQFSADEAAALERDLQRSPELQQLLDSVEVTRRVIRTQAIRTQVRQVHERFITHYRQQTSRDQVTDAEEPRIVPLHSRPTGNRQPFGWITRVAATVLLGLVGYGGYQFATTDRQRVYDDIFVTYRLPTTRDAGTPQSVTDSLYRAGRFAAVVERLAATPPAQRQPRPQFLAALSYLQLRNYPAALDQFRALRVANRRSTMPYFEPETDYYEALAYLGAQDYDRALAQFQRIHDDPRHMFHGNVSQLDLWTIKLLSYR